MLQTDIFQWREHKLQVLYTVEDIPTTSEYETYNTETWNGSSWTEVNDLNDRVQETL